MDTFGSWVWEVGPFAGCWGEVDLGVSEGEGFGGGVVGEIESEGAFFGVAVGHVGLEEFVEVVPGDSGEVELEVFGLRLEGEWAEWWGG